MRSGVRECNVKDLLIECNKLSKSTRNKGFDEEFPSQRNNLQSNMESKLTDMKEMVS